MSAITAKRKAARKQLLSGSELTRRVSRALTWAIVCRVTGRVPICIEGRASAREWAKYYSTGPSKNPHMVKRANLRLLGERA